MSRLEVRQIRVVTIPKLLGGRALPGRSGNQYAAKLLRCRGRVEGQDSQMHNNICQVLLELYRHDLTTKQVVCFLGHLHLLCVRVLLEIDLTVSKRAPVCLFLDAAPVTNLCRW